MPNERTVHVVDDDAAVRLSLERLLGAAGFEVRAYDGPMAFLDVAASFSRGCVLLDISMPVMDGLEVQRRLLQRHITLPVVVMTGEGDIQSAVRAMKAGAIDFIEKPCDDEVLINAVEAALARGSRPEPQREAVEAAKRISRLSMREREVLDALMAGNPNKVIAFDLGISVRTVEVHRARMMHRLGVHQLAEAIRLAVMAQLAPAADPARRPGER
jgi:two-component system response regulator FixJ